MDHSSPHSTKLVFEEPTLEFVALFGTLTASIALALYGYLGTFSRYGSDDYSGFSIGVTVLQPRSIGTVHIGTTDPSQQALMDPRYLSAEDDIRLVTQGIGIARRFAESPSLKKLIVRETRPGIDVRDGDALLEYVRATTATSWHMVGTCKMGVDPMAVVDPELRVHGVAGLRVIDSSICPTIPSTNTNAPTLAIAEKGAAMVMGSP